MSKTEYPGIDYSLGQSNRDTETGIHYGLLSVHSATAFDWECDTEIIYLPYCPHCYEALDEDFESPSPCPYCEQDIDEGEEYSDYAEPDCIKLTAEGYEGFVSEQNEIWVLKSPYYTHAQYCSPCAPGAGNLNSPCDDGPKTYCLGPEFFADNKAPYPVFKVEN